MQRRKLVLGLILIGAMGGWAAFRPERLFVDKTVSEGFAVGAEQTASTATPLAAGTFENGAHETAGTASVYTLPGDRRVLRLTDFHTSNGPDVHVYLVKAADVMDDDTVKNAGFVDLGSIKGNVGDQNYDIPAGVDLDAYRTVTIWCKRFGVNFGSAPLAMSMPPSNEPVALTTGEFHSVAHETRGTATVFQLPTGKRVLRLTGFETSNGPDVQVYLVAAADATDNDTVKNAGFVNVAALKGNVGDQNYELPDDLDLGTYRAVTIWCRRFGVNFGTAPLRPRES